MKNSENINHPRIRQQLIDRYMNSETTPEEERLLNDYFLHHTPEKEEEDVALMIRVMQGMASPNATITPDAEQVFDEIIRGAHPSQEGGHHPSSKKTFPWRSRLFAVSGIAATILVMLVMAWGYHIHLSESASKRSKTVATVQETASLTKRHSPSEDRKQLSLPMKQERIISQVIQSEPSHLAYPIAAKKKLVSTGSHQHEDSMTVLDLVDKLQNFQALASANDEQIELRPVGDAAIITTSDSSGTRRSYLSFGPTEDHTLSFLVLDN